MDVDDEAMTTCNGLCYDSHQQPFYRFPCSILFTRHWHVDRSWRRRAVIQNGNKETKQVGQACIGFIK